MAGIFNPAIFNNAIFNVGDVGAEEVVKTGTGGIDPGEGARRIVKPLGTLHVRKKDAGPAGVSQRVDESRGIQAEIAARLAREFGEESAALDAREVAALTAAEIEREIGILMRKRLRTDEDEVMLLLLMAVAAAL